MSNELTELLLKPKIINWIEMPSVIGEEEHIEFLKKDVFLQRQEGLMAHMLKMNKMTEIEAVYFFNLDRILHRNSIKSSDAVMFSKNFIQFINKYFSFKSLVHTNIIDDSLSSLFRSEGIAFIEKNLEEKKTALSTTLDMIKPFFSLNNSVIRSYIRVNLEKYKYRIEIQNNQSSKPPFIGFLKDISVNGASVQLTNHHHTVDFNLKDTVYLTMYVRQFLIKIRIGIVTRVDKSKDILGIHYDINNQKMVSMMSSETISKLIYYYLQEALKIVSA